MRDRVERNEFLVRTRDVDTLELFGIKAIDPLDLRNDLVAAAGDVEPVNVIAADRCGQISTDLRHVEPHRRDLVMIENNLRLRLIDLRVDVRKAEHAGLHGFHLQILRQLKNPVLVSR